MRRILVALVVALSAVARTAASQEAVVMATVSQFVNSFNIGDTKAVAAACAEQAVIIDEFPPHAWDGAGACARWMADYDTNAKKDGITDGIVTLSKPRHVDITGDRAYVVVPADYAYKQHGQPVKETGSIFTLVLERKAASWRISAWSWAKN